MSGPDDNGLEKAYGGIRNALGLPRPAESVSFAPDDPLAWAVLLRKRRMTTGSPSRELSEVKSVHEE